MKRAFSRAALISLGVVADLTPVVRMTSRQTLPPHMSARILGAEPATPAPASPRGLDRLRGNGWKGWGPVPFSHEPNQGVLRAIAALGHAAKAIGEDDEYDRIRQMLSDADPDSVATLLD